MPSVAPSDEHVEFGGVVGVGHAGNPREADKQQHEQQQQHPQRDREAVETNMPVNSGVGVAHGRRPSSATGRAELQAGGRASEQRRKTAPAFQRGSDHPHQQDQHDRAHSDQFRPERQQRRAERSITAVEQVRGMFTARERLRKRFAAAVEVGFALRRQCTLCFGRGVTAAGRQARPMTRLLDGSTPAPSGWRGRLFAASSAVKFVDQVG